MLQLRNIEAEDFQTFKVEIERQSNHAKRSIELTWWYASARFQINRKDFENKCSIDGANDGGIDFLYKDGNTFYIIQAKYYQNLHRENFSTLETELSKIESTLKRTRTSKKQLTSFLNDLTHSFDDEQVYLEVIWLTTSEVSDKLKKDAKAFLDAMKQRNGWRMQLDLIFIDRHSIQNVLYDINHGFVPHTGKKSLKYQPNEIMRVNDKIDCYLVNISAMEILSWFKDEQDISSFLQKNVRECVGDTKINMGIRDSFKSNPDWFWYKHNGIIVFSDWLDHDEKNKLIVLRNPQIVNGAQTITQLFKVKDQKRDITSEAKLLVRIYRLSYENSETYKHSIDIISALNSQSKIKLSDLKSTDQRQVLLENRFKELSTRIAAKTFTYIRKRSEQNTSGRMSISMVKLALIYHVCSEAKPDEGITGNLEKQFEDDKKYNKSFPEASIKKEIGNYPDHIVFKYIECWITSTMIDSSGFKNTLIGKSDRAKDLYKFTKWYMLVDVYQQLQRLKADLMSKGTIDDKIWFVFLNSDYYKDALLEYLGNRHKQYLGYYPKSETDPKAFYANADMRARAANSYEHKNTYYSFQMLMNTALRSAKRDL